MQEKSEILTQATQRNYARKGSITESAGVCCLLVVGMVLVYAVIAIILEST
jgi:hypothetical protein